MFSSRLRRNSAVARFVVFDQANLASHKEPDHGMHRQRNQHHHARQQRAVLTLRGGRLRLSPAPVAAKRRRFHRGAHGERQQIQQQAQDHANRQRRAAQNGLESARQRRCPVGQ
jgi:hypothetical protein